ncbi:MAG: ribosomal RNA small subunit methyltransferase A [Candidatus Xiphinematobacter sp.]|nr:MAG: ribosomal RNA small subunit methyltransferase A [Candidatus Xiphinematobacter sp.]
MTLKEVRDCLRKLALEPAKSLGQNFLHDQNLARWMVSRLSLDHGDHVVELGPGLGALTEYLMQAGVGRITVVEKDGRLAGALVQRLGNTLHVIQEDATRVDLLRFYGFGRVKVIGNLPYYVSSPILMRFLNKLSPAIRLVFAVQRELAERLVAAPHTREYGIMTVCIQHRWKIQLLRNLSPSVFYPKPRVHSSIILFTPREVVHFCDEALFERIVYLGFSERRKQLRKLLGNTKGVWEKFAEEMGISPLARAEELSHADYAELACRLSPFRPQTMAARAEELDVVDFQNRVVTRVPRAEIHTENLPHRSVHVLIRNRVGKWFLQRRSIWKDSNPGKWDSSVAGHLLSGEGYEIAARRELCEELGVTRCDWLLKKGSLQASAETGWEFIEVFFTQQEGPFSLTPMEIDIGAFFEEETIQRWIRKEPGSFTTTFLQCFDLIVNDH